MEELISGLRPKGKLPKEVGGREAKSKGWRDRWRQRSRFGNRVRKTWNGKGPVVLKDQRAWVVWSEGCAHSGE